MPSSQKSRLSSIALLGALIFFAFPSAAASPQRIVSLTPSVTEILFALGAGDEVVGVSQYCDYPPEVTRLPKVGSFLTPNLEAIVALHPTLVIGIGLSSEMREIRALRETGCSIMTIQDDSVAEIEDSIRAVGGKIGRADAARALLEKLNAQIDAVHSRVAALPRVRVLMLVGHEPLIAVGPGTYLDDLLKLANADNIADSIDQQWPKLSVEYILAMRPEVILDGQMGSDPAAPARYWQRYSSIPAVRDHRVYSYPGDPVLHAGPRIGTSLQILAALIHPDAFHDSSALGQGPLKVLLPKREGGELASRPEEHRDEWIFRARCAPDEGDQC
jgi:iron complex transport system substrate-binding protein